MAKTKLFPRRNATTMRRPVAAPTPVPPPAPTQAKPTVSDTEPTPERAASGSKVVDRIGVPIDASGGFDLDSMRPVTRSRFEAALRKTKISAGPKDDSGSEFRPVALMAVDAIVSLQVMAATVLRCTPQEARHLAWDSAHKSVLADQLAAVLARHPQWMQNAPEALLGATYCGMLVGSLQAIKQEREIRTSRPPTAQVSDPPNLGSESLQ